MLKTSKQEDGFAVPVPKYYVVLNVLRESFANCRPGDRLPSESEFVKQFRVSRMTLQRALATLVSEGVIVRIQGKGTFYVGESKTTKRPQAISGALESLMVWENDARAKVVGKARSSEVPVEVHRQLQREGETFVIIRRVAIVDAEPFAYIINYLPREIGDKVYDEDAALRFTPIVYLLRKKHGIVFTRAEQTIAAVLAEPEIAKALEVPIGMPVLHIERTYFTRVGRPIQFTRSWYRSDRHKYTVSLSEWSNQAPKKRR
jgi:GntR family transcriptional regulator